MSNRFRAFDGKNILFITIVLILSAIYGLMESMNTGPYSRHQWRQADCLSITQNYTQENLPFLEPQIHWQGEKNTGKTISEFPIIYFSVGQIWKLTGTQYWIYRVLNLMILIAGLLFLKKTIMRLFNDEFWSFFVPLFLFTSPLLIYYSNNFLMNSTAFGLVLIAGYHFLKFRQEDRYVNLVYACSLFALAGMLKITSLLLFFALGGYLLYDILIRKKALLSRWKELIPFGASILVIGVWYSYAASYNEQNLKHVFLQGILPIWEMKFGEIASHLKILNNELKPEFFYPPALFMLFLSFLYLLLFMRKGNAFFLALGCLLLFGIGTYMLMFFQVFDVHEYYLLNLLIIVPVFSVLILNALKTNLPAAFSSKKIKVFATILLLFLVYNGALRNRVKYNASSKLLTGSPILTNYETDLWRWYHWNYNNTLGGLESIEPYLHKIGVTREKRVVSIPDQSINISLYLMNRKGFTDYGYSDIKDGDRIEWAKEKGAEYLVINDTSLISADYLQPYIKNKVGEFRHVTIYKL